MERKTVTVNAAWLAVSAALLMTASASALPYIPLAPAHRAAHCPRPRDPISIDSVTLSDNPVHTGESVSATVRASCNVAAMTASIGSYRIGVPKISAGLFQKTVRVPYFIMPGRVSVTVTAIRTDGATVDTRFPVDIRW